MSGAPNYGDIGQGLGSIFGAFGDFEEAGAYRTAEDEARQNEVFTTQMGKVKEFQAQRQVNLVGGAQAAGYSAGNLALSGSAASVMRNTVQQGALEHGIIGMQTGAASYGYYEQAQQFRAMAGAAETAGIGGLASAAFDVGSAFIPGG
jgi:hypothetical protein